MWLSTEVHLPVKVLSSAEWQQSNIERKALGILHALIKFHHYCFAKKVYVIIEHKPLVAMISKDVAALAQQLQCIMLHIHQYSVCILYKTGPTLCMADILLCHYDVENGDHEIPGMKGHGRHPHGHIYKRHMNSNRGRSRITSTVEV